MDRIDIAGISLSEGAVMEKSLSLLGVFGRVFVGGGFSLSSGPRTDSSPLRSGVRTTTLLALLTVVLSMTGVSTATAAAGLPDARRWEMVTPSEKGDADVVIDSRHVLPSADGNAIVFSSLESFGDVRGNLIVSDFMAVRDQHGWHTHGLTPQQEPLTVFQAAFGPKPGFRREFSPDLSKGIYLSNSALTDAPNAAAASNLYLLSDLRTPSARSYRLITDATTVQSAAGAVTAPWDAGTSADFSRILFESVRDLTDDAAGLSTDVPKLYEWTDGVVRLAGILPASEGGGPAPSSQAGQGAWNGFGTDRTISADGSRIVYSVPGASNTFCDVRCGRLYLRDDHGTTTTGDDESIFLNASERTDCADSPGSCTGSPAPDPAGPQPGMFWGASADDGEIFFTTTEQLTDDDHNAFVDLYRYSVDASAGHHLTRISIDNEPSDGDGADVNGVVGVSLDGSYVYFVVTDGQLVAGGPTVSTADNPAGARIFVWHDGAIHEVAGVNTGPELARIAGLSTWTAVSEHQTARITPDGTHLVFTSQGTDELTGYTHGNAAACADITTASDACAEVYVYDATANGGSGHLACASCNPTGEAGTQPASTSAYYQTGAAGATTHANRPISDDGRFVFFTTAERLVSEDTNGIQDAYEYDTTTGRVHLLSSGVGTLPSFFVDASASGDDAFFATRQHLVSSDTDNAADLYDARVDGLADTPVTTPPVCASFGECRGTAIPTPASIVTPSSTTFGGLGDLTPSVVKRITPKPLTKAQKLARALKKCQTKRKKVQRKKCVASARKRFGRTK
jgi:hypothetical protein